MLTVYGYDKCTTCRNAKKALAANNINFTWIDVTENPPSEAILKASLASGIELKKLLNTSGVQYRELDMKTKLKTMSEDDVIALLASNGRLLKRPIVTNGTSFTVGYKEADFAKAWL